MSQDLHQPLMTGSGKSSDIGVKQFSRWAVGIFFLPREYQPLVPMPRTRPVSFNAAVIFYFKEPSSEEKEGLLTCIFMLSKLT